MEDWTLQAVEMNEVRSPVDKALVPTYIPPAAKMPNMVPFITIVDKASNHEG